MSNPDPSIATLDQRLDDLARTPTLLVASDYDGTLAPIVENPERAYPHRESIAALRSLAALPDTHVAVISGRALRDLATLSRLPAEVFLVGSHGSEFDVGFATALEQSEIELRERLFAELREIAGSSKGFQVEEKPAGAAFHYRNATNEDAERAVAQIFSGPAKVPGVSVKNGKKVIELAVVKTDKGKALDLLRRQISADAVLFLGDDVTDEDAFRQLRGPDLGVKVGPGETLASHRVATTEAAAHFLARLFELRRGWIEGSAAPNIEEHSMLSDQRTVALVTPDARINWFCQPRADSPALFAELLGGKSAGFFQIRPVDGRAPISQRYVPDSLILETRWSDLRLNDFLDVSQAASDGREGGTRLVRVIEGRGDVRIEFAPRLDYGRAATGVEILGSALLVRGSSQNILLNCSQGSLHWTLLDDGPHKTAVADVALDGSLVLELVCDGTPQDVQAAAGLPTWQARKEASESHFREWARSLELPTVARAEVLRSALTLKALCYQPSGAILAAATTSLPEVAGGVRNWDYRYCWPRDAALSAAALVALGSYGEARAFLGWLQERVEHLASPEQLRPLYAVVGDDFVPEAVLPTLNGYLGSRPVRIGNAADQQVQMDVFGPIVELVFRLAARRQSDVEKDWPLVQAMVSAISRRWSEPDHGIWEARMLPKHHVYSKVMCWQTVDRGLRIADLLEQEAPGDWPGLRDAIASEVLEKGWSEEAQAYTGAYGERSLDASALFVGLSGLLEVHDPRFEATVRGIERELCRGPAVYRYRYDDGLPGDEGAFLLCTAWLIQSYALLGRRADAQSLFSYYRSLAGSTGLFAEQVDPGTGRILGNHPQAYSHLGLIQSALMLEAVESGIASGGDRATRGEPLR